ncbi:hypothetical protein QZH41_018728 [Actinostola sp. cb2023]|nr:hypothetical protein QZH41_018728 [Actinostola sp. cb2023]
MHSQTKTFVGLEKEEWIFIIISIINILLAILFTIVSMTKVSYHSSDFTFAIIVLINAVFCIFYAVHGVLREREFEVYAFIAAITVVFVYLFINLIVALTSTPIKTDSYFYIKLVEMYRRAGPHYCSSAVCFTDNNFLIHPFLLGPFRRKPELENAFFGSSSLLNIYYGVKVARDFGYLEFRTVGAAIPLQKMYRRAGIFSCLLKFDFELALSLAVLVVYNPEELNTSDKIIVGVGIPFQFFWSVLGWCTMRKETRYPGIVFIALSFVEPAYIIYWFYNVINKWVSLTNGSSKRVLVYSFVVVATIALLIRVLVIIALKFVVDNFGKGLRESVYNIPDSEEQSLLARKRDPAKCCGIICCGPLG